jgi:hypothetical protein
MFASQVSQVSQLPQHHFANLHINLDGGAIFLKFSKNHCLSLCRLCHLSQKLWMMTFAKEKRPLP